MSEEKLEHDESVGVEGEEKIEERGEEVGRKIKRRGPGKIPEVIIEKREEKDDERFLTIHFSPKLLKSAPLWKRARKAMKLLQRFVEKHIKYVEATIDEAGTRAKVRITEPIIWVSPEVNEIIWSRGAKNPPKRIRVRVLIKVEEVLRDAEGKPTGCRAELKVFPS